MSVLPPPPAQQPALSQDQVPHVIPPARTKAHRIGQGMNKQQLTAADGKMRSLTA